MTAPATPLVEDEALDLGARLEAGGADEETLAFARSLQSRGYAILDLGEEGRGLCDRAAAETERVFADPRVERVQDLWRRAPAVRRLATHPRLLAALRSAYGREPFPFQTLSFRTGTQQPAHADTIHFHSDPPRFMCGVWTALEDVAADAGPLLYWPGSHRWPILTLRGGPEPQRAGAGRLRPLLPAGARRPHRRIGRALGGRDRPQGPGLRLGGQPGARRSADPS